MQNNAWTSELKNMLPKMITFQSNKGCELLSSYYQMDSEKWLFNMKKAKANKINTTPTKGSVGQEDITKNGKLQIKISPGAVLWMGWLLCPTQSLSG